ncbi:DUF998 domain-containing protein [Glutamicibacter sp.]|uniref:DUF998 domain-containing protein n=1 Tax=Glutamicibacter sp. TaxID=1931995 RepID=UPI0028BD602E|nr:DUF998 domain-containing protein [Glutamicibacter sp.]
MNKNNFDGARAAAGRAALGAGAVVYSSGMAAEALLKWPLNPTTTLLSELAARDRSYRRIFQTGDLCAGGLFAASGALLGAREGKLLPLCLGVFGAATIADALSPLDYPISHASLRPGHPAGQWTPSASHTAHYVTTTIAGSAAAGICLVHWRMARSLPPQHPAAGVVRRIAAPAVVGLLLTGVATLASDKLLPGMVQRVQTLGFSALCVDLAAMTARRRRWRATRG